MQDGSAHSSDDLQLREVDDDWLLVLSITCVARIGSRKYIRYVYVMVVGKSSG